MSHELEIAPNGEASFVYNGGNGKPWHRLGVEVNGHMTAEEAFEKANADYTVWMEPVYVQDQRTGEFVKIEDRYATVRHNPFDDSLQPYEVFTPRYTPFQNRLAFDGAMEIVGASEGHAGIDTLGVLNEGRQFFATIDLGTLIIDPNGANDRIQRYLVVKNSHDGSSPLLYANTDVRVVCSNTLRMAEKEAKAVFKARHTPNAEARVAEAKTVLGLSTEWAESFERMANELLTIPVPRSSQRFDTVMEILKPSKDADTDRKKANRDEYIGTIKAIYGNDRNGGYVGENGWGLYNAIVEFNDWHRGGTERELVEASLDESGLISRRKKEAQAAILSLV